MLRFVLIVKTIIFGLFKQYRGWWRYVGISDLTGIVRASLVSTMLIFGLWVAGLYIDPVRKGLSNVIRRQSGRICHGYVLHHLAAGGTAYGNPALL